MNGYINAVVYQLANNEWVYGVWPTVVVSSCDWPLGNVESCQQGVCVTRESSVDSNVTFNNTYVFVTGCPVS